MSNIILFPDPRREKYARNVARTIQGYSPAGADRYAASQAEAYRRSLVAAGCGVTVADLHCSAFAASIRYWSNTSSNRGGAA